METRTSEMSGWKDTLQRWAYHCISLLIQYISSKLAVTAPVALDSQEQPDRNLQIEVGPETEFVGVITKTHAESCEISAKLNGTEEVLSVNERQFDTQGTGIRCDGDMTTLPEEGKDGYEVCEPKPIVTIAWLGDKTEVAEDEPETENEGKGVITKIANNSCEMSASINGTQQSLSFHRRIFYTFGIRCEGNLANIVEEGMEVDFCYSVCESEIVIIAVWLGEKPDELTDDLPEAVYNEKGRILEILDTGTFIVQSDHMPGTVLVDARVVYRRGAPNAADLAVNDDITFDAIPLESEDESGAWYEATCAWIGEVPGIVDRFGLNIPDTDNSAKLGYDLKQFQENCVDGTVAVIVNEFVAFVDVEYGGCIEHAMLFRSSFQRSCKSLQDVVSVGDRILLLLGIGSIFYGCGRLYAAKAWRNIEEKNQCMAEGENQCKAEEKIVELKAALSPQMNVVDMDHCPVAPQNQCLSSSFNVKSKVLYPSLTGVIRPYAVKSGPKIKIKACKLQHLAVIKSTDNLLSILVRLTDFYVNGKACVQPKTFASIAQSNSTVVNFEGVRNPQPELKLFKCCAENISHVVTCAWIGPKPSFKTVAARSSAEALPSLPKNPTRFTGNVNTFYLPDRAIVTICKLNKIVCLHVNSFPPKAGANLITDYVKLKQQISFQVVPDPECEIPVLAVNVQLK